MSANGSSKTLGFSDCMGPELRAFVERRLLVDLNFYLPDEPRLHLDDVCFDWSESCIEGHRTRWLDGDIENFSGIAVFDLCNKLIAEGWMEFILTENGLEVFWWYLHGGNDYAVRSMTSNGVPHHVWNKLSNAVRSDWLKYAPSVKPLPI